MSFNINLTQVPNKFAAFLTHDIDFLFRYGSLFSLGKNLAGDIVNRKSIKNAGETILNYTRFKKGLTKDPFDTFDELMDMSELYGLKSSFFFKPAILSEKDSTYSITDQRVQNIIKHIYHRGHEIGFHPSVNTFHNEVQFKIEYERIKSIGIPVYGGRQHYLLYDICETFNFWENSGLSYDSGLGFYQRFGFRCGICLPFSVFDIKNRNVLKLIQKPLCVMDAAMVLSDPVPEQFYENIVLILNQVKKHSGIFVCLWHNDGFSRPENTKYKIVYEDILKLL